MKKDKLLYVVMKSGIVRVIDGSLESKFIPKNRPTFDHFPTEADYYSIAIPIVCGATWIEQEASSRDGGEVVITRVEP